MPKPKVSTTFNAVDKMSGPMKKMNKKVSGFSRNTQRSFRNVGSSINRFRGLMTGALAVITTGAIAKGVTEFAKAGDEIAKTARQIGMTSEALQELRFAADRQGISNEEFTKSIQQMNKFVGQARVNTGALYSILQKSNPALLEQLKTVDSSEQAFELLVEQINAMPNQLDKAALANAAFGRSGQAFLIMAENGVKGIQDLREEARKYGNIISGEAAAASEKFVDSMTNMKSAMMSVRNKALTPLIEKIQPLIQKMADWVASNQNLINQKIEKTFKTIGKAAKIVGRAWDSGLIPALLAGAVAFKTASIAITGTQGLIVGITALRKVAKGGSILKLLTGGPAGLIAAAIAAAAFGIFMLIKHWDKVKAAVAGFGEKAVGVFRRVMENPFIKAAATVLFPWISIPLLVIKNWEKVKDTILGIWNKIKAPFEKVSEFFKTIKGTSADISAAQNHGLAAAGGAHIPGLIGRNDAMIQNSTITSRSQVDINMAGLPQGSSVRQTGRAPGVTLNYGYAQGGLNNAR